eukprot:COSAG02_NODE_9447_length_2213_cov_2.165090_3_plen_103_part_01
MVCGLLAGELPFDARMDLAADVATRHSLESQLMGFQPLDELGEYVLDAMKSLEQTTGRPEAVLKKALDDLSGGSKAIIKQFKQDIVEAVRASTPSHDIVEATR